MVAARSKDEQHPVSPAFGFYHRIQPAFKAQAPPLRLNCYIHVLQGGLPHYWEGFKSFVTHFRAMNTGLPLRVVY